MLTNYDAKAVADVMGIAFFRTPDGAQASESGDGNETFILRVNHELAQMVDSRSRKRFVTPGKRKRPRSQGRALDFAQAWTASSVLIEKAVENGLPRIVLRHVAEQIAGNDTRRISALEWGIVPKTILERREEQLSPSESERTERVARLFVHARRALGSEAEARAFMTNPHPELDGRTPVDAARSDLSTRRTEQLLNALEYGLAL